MQLLNKYKDPFTSKDVFIGRGYPLGNPYVIGKDGDRVEVIARYEEWFLRKLIDRDPLIEQAFRALTEDSRLVCYCAPVSCHGDIIIRHSVEMRECDDYENWLETIKFKYPHYIGYHPKYDGVNHINIYSKSKVLLGRLLSNFAELSFIHPDHGKFQSLEGFYYYLATGACNEALRSLSGFEAKKIGRTKPRVECENFNSEMEEAINLKIEQNQEFRNRLCASTLPFTHYYYFGTDDNCKIVRTDETGQWWVNAWEKARRDLKAKLGVKLIIAGTKSIEDLELVRTAYRNSGFNMIELVCGMAPGVDLLGKDLADVFDVHTAEFPADWGRFYKSAGYIRNNDMGRYGDALLAIWDEKSPGTKHMIETMRRLNKPVKVFSTKRNAFLD